MSLASSMQKTAYSNTVNEFCIDEAAANKSPKYEFGIFSADNMAYLNTANELCIDEQNVKS